MPQDDAGRGAAALRAISQTPRAAADIVKRIDEDPAPPAAEGFNPKQRVFKPGAAVSGERMRKIIETTRRSSDSFLKKKH